MSKLKDVLSKVVSTVVKGTLKLSDEALIGGVVHNVTEDNEDSPKGTLDVNRLIRGLIISGLIIYGCSDKAIEIFNMLY